MVKTQLEGHAADGSARNGAAAAHRDRRSRYAAIAKMAAVTAGVGGVVGVSEASTIITGSGFTVSVNGPLSSSVPANNRVSYSNDQFGDARLNGIFYGYAVFDRVPNNLPNREFRRSAYLGVDGTGGDLHIQGLLAAGDVVGGGLAFQDDTSIRAQSFAALNGAWGANTNEPIVIGGSDSVRGYLAFRLNDGSDHYYGYFDVEWSRTGVGDGSTLSLTIHGWAYNSVAGQSITIAGASAVPGGTGLAALAVGAVGLRGRRRSRN